MKVERLEPMRETVISRNLTEVVDWIKVKRSDVAKSLTKPTKRSRSFFVKDVIHVTNLSTM